jgi:hypothetical protein
LTSGAVASTVCFPPEVANSSTALPAYRCCLSNEFLLLRSTSNQGIHACTMKIAFQFLQCRPFKYSPSSFGLEKSGKPTIDVFCGKAAGKTGNANAYHFVCRLLFHQD